MSERVAAMQDRVLIGLVSREPRVEREALYDLPPWRAAMLARIACSMGVMPRAERDGIIREASYVGGSGQLKPWANRTKREQEKGVRG